MSKTIDKLVKEAGENLLEAVWQEANTFGEHTTEVIDLIHNADDSDMTPTEIMDRVTELTGKSRIGVLLGSLQHANMVIIREHAASEYVKFRRLQDDFEAEQAAPPVAEETAPEHTDGEPTFEAQVQAERLRQMVELGYGQVHDDESGVKHLYRIRNSYPRDSVKYAAMNLAISDWYDRNTVEEDEEEDLLDD